MAVWLSLLVAVVGVLMYALANNPKVQEMGRIAFFTDLLVFLMGADAVVALIQRR